jgi:hydrogenase-1 operon protein HyaE
MPSPLIEKLLTRNGYPRVDASTVEAFINGDGDRVLFLTGDPAKNLETDDLAVILPELVKAFQNRFQPAIVDRALEQSLRERFDIWPLPSLIFIEQGRLKGAIAKIRDWDDYLSEIGRILGRSAAATEH